LITPAGSTSPFRPDAPRSQSAAALKVLGRDHTHLGTSGASGHVLRRDQHRAELGFRGRVHRG